MLLAGYYWSREEERREERKRHAQFSHYSYSCSTNSPIAIGLPILTVTVSTAAVLRFTIISNIIVAAQLNKGTERDRHPSGQKTKRSVHEQPLVRIATRQQQYCAWQKLSGVNFSFRSGRKAPFLPERGIAAWADGQPNQGGSPYLSARSTQR